MRTLLMVALLFPALAWAGATDELLSRLQKLQSLKGDFEQTVLDKGGTHMQQAEGRFQVARGNQFYWSTTSPFSQLAVSDGKTVWISGRPRPCCLADSQARWPRRSASASVTEMARK